jgi:hypothetical protein
MNNILKEDKMLSLFEGFKSLITVTQLQHTNIKPCDGGDASDG